MARINPIYCPRCSGAVWSACIGELLTFDTADALEEGRWSPMPVLVHCANKECYPARSGILSQEDTELLISTGMFKRLMNNPKEIVEIQQPKKTLKAKLKRKEPD